MSAFFFRIVLVFCVVGFVFNPISCLWAQDSAPSSHLVFDDNFDGDIIVNQVRVPRDGDAMYTYYETLGWRGKAAGYAGIQSHPRAKNFIFSIWDHKEHTAPIRPVYRGPGTETTGFGGEGTGLKSWNFELGWKPDQWYTLVSRCWPVEDHTYFGFWVRSEDDGMWTHLVTMDVATKGARFRGGTDAFIEDWLSTGKNKREVHFRNGWKRDMNRSWKAFGAARYSVNYWDLEKGKRSFNFRESWNGGTVSKEKESYYFMQSGGRDTTPKVKNPSSHQIKRNETTPEFEVAKIQSLNAIVKADGKLTVSWKMDRSSSPQFGYTISVQNNHRKEKEKANRILKTINRTVPHERTFDILLNEAEIKQELKVTLECVDLFGKKSVMKSAVVKVSVDSNR